MIDELSTVFSSHERVSAVSCSEDGLRIRSRARVAAENVLKRSEQLCTHALVRSFSGTLSQQVRDFEKGLLRKYKPASKQACLSCIIAFALHKHRGERAKTRRD